MTQQTMNLPTGGTAPFSIEANFTAAQSNFDELYEQTFRHARVVNIAPTGTDDNVAINAAIAALAGEPGVIQLLPGEYQIASAIRLVSNTFLRGSGRGVTTLKLKAGTALLTDGLSNVVFVRPEDDGDDIENFGISDLSINGNRSNLTLPGVEDSTGNGICIRGSSSNLYVSKKFFIKNVESYGCVFHGVAIYGGVKDFIALDNEFHGNGFRGIHVHGNDDSGASGYLVCNNIIHDNGVDGIGPGPDRTGLNNNGTNTGLFVCFQNTFRAIVSNNVVYDEPGYGISVTGIIGDDTIVSEFNVVSGNTVNNCGVGVKIGHGAAGLVLANNAITNCVYSSSANNGVGVHFYTENGAVIKNIIVSGNIISGNDGWGIAASGTSDGDFQNITISGNQVHGNGLRDDANTGGININRAEQCIICDNAVVNNIGGLSGNRQIYLTYANNCIVSGNVVDSGTQNTTPLEVASSCTFVHVVNNYSRRGPGGNTIVVSGTNCIASGNIGQTLNNGTTCSAGKFNLTVTSGEGSALLGANCPATTLSAPYTWIPIHSSDNSICYIPAWK